MNCLYVGIVVLYLSHCHGQSTIVQETCDVGIRKTDIQMENAGAILHGMTDFHQAGFGASGCGEISTGSMQSFEAMRWALSVINQDSALYVPGIKIGLSVYDTCRRAELAIDGLTESFPQTISRRRDCQTSNDTISLGVIGPRSNVEAIPVAKFLTQIPVPLVSFGASNPMLNDKSRFPYFLRTTASDSEMAKAAVEVLNSLQWGYVVLVHSNDIYGKSAMETLKDSASQSNICITQVFEISSTSNSTEMQEVLNGALSTGVKGAIYAGNPEALKYLFQEGGSGRVSNSGQLQWLVVGGPLMDVKQIESLTYARGAIVLRPGGPRIAEFEDHWVAIDPGNPPSDNPFYRDWYMTKNQCKLRGIVHESFGNLPTCNIPSTQQRRSTFEQDTLVPSVAFAIFTYAKALKNAQRAKCGIGSSGICNQLRQMTANEFFNTYMKNTDLTFGLEERIPSLASGIGQRVRYDVNGNLVGVEIDILNYNSRIGTLEVQKVGQFKDGSLQLRSNEIRMYGALRTTALSSLPTSPCPGGTCLNCIITNTKPEYMHIAGDILIGMVTSVHFKGSHGSLCGNLDLEAVENIEAFTYALRQVSSRNLLNGVTLGGLVLDDCQDPNLITSLVTNMENGLVSLNDSSDREIDPRTVVSYAGAFSSFMTVPLARILTELHKPLIGYAATSVELSDRSKFPYFARTIPSDAKMTKAIILILKRMNWSYVQTLQSADSYGRSGITELRKLANAEGICIAASYEFGTDGSMQEIVSKLQQNVEARAVVVFANPSDARDLFSVISSTNNNGDFVILGTDSWANNGNIVLGSELGAFGSLSVGLKEFTLPAFSTHLQQLDVTRYSTNPWFKEWFQEAFNCSLDSSSSERPLCSNPSTNSITSAPNFQFSIWNLSVMNAVHSIARGLHETLKHFCGASYSGVCPAFRNSKDKGRILIQKINKVTFTDESSRQFVFENGEGIVDYVVYNYQGTGNGFQQVGEYTASTDTLQLSVKTVKFPSGAPNVTSRCTKQCPECQSLYQYQPFMYEPGEVLIGGVVGVHMSGDTPFSCGRIQVGEGPMNMQVAEAIAYAVKEVNSKRAPVRLSGTTLGMLFLDSCSSSVRENNLISSVHSGALHLTRSGNDVDSGIIHAWITSGSEASMNSQGTLSSLSMLQVSPFATSIETKNNIEHPTLYRTIPADDSQVDAMAKLAAYLGWTSVQIVYDASLYAKSAVDAFRRAAELSGICISAVHVIGPQNDAVRIVQTLLQSPKARAVVVFLDNPSKYVKELLLAKAAQTGDSNELVFIGSDTWGTSTDVIKGAEAIADGSMTVQVDSSPISGFDNYLQSKTPRESNSSNPWFDEYYQALARCDLPNNFEYGVSCATPYNPITNLVHYQQNKYVLHITNAVFAITQAMESVLLEKCGQGYVGICEAFRIDEDVNKKIVEKMAETSFTDLSQQPFTFQDREGTKSFKIYRYTNRNYREIGSYISSNAISITDSSVKTYYQTVQATCVGECQRTCLGVTAEQEQFTFIDGDILLGGVFDVSKKGTTPFSCGEINDKYGFQLLEAFNFAIDTVNKKEGIFLNKLNGVSLGGIGLDACQSANRAGTLIANIHSSSLKLQGPNKKIISPNTIDTYIGGLESDSSRRMADILTVFGIPQITYGASTIDLSNTLAYPYLLRTVPADDKQARAIISILKRYGFQYVQVVSSRGEYGEPMAAEFINLAPKHKICVAQHLHLDSTKTKAVDVAAAVVATKLLRRNATVVVTMLDRIVLHPFLSAVKANTESAGVFFFVASNTWGRDTDIITGVETEVLQSLSIGIETADVQKFDEYLYDKTPSNYQRNPWFNAYYQKIFKCNLPGESGYASQCLDTTQSIPRSTSYKQDPYVLYVINAVYAAALGIHNALVQLCGSRYRGACDDFRTAGQKRVEILKGIKQVAFTDEAGQPFSITENGDSNRGYSVFQLMELSGVYDFQNIGSYNDTHSLKIRSDIAVSWQSPCGANGCSECPLLGNQQSRFMQTDTKDQDLNILAVFPVHALGSTPYNCGQMQVGLGFQNMLAFFYALDQINQDNKKLSTSIQFGGLALDTCANFVRSRSDLYSLMSGQGICNVIPGQSIMNPGTVVAAITTGTAETRAAHEIFDPLKITYISQSATADSLSDMSTFPFFLRTVPPDRLQAKAMVEILQIQGWNYVVAVHSDNEYGSGGVDAFIHESGNKSICVTQRHKLIQDATDQDARDVLQEITKAVGVNVVVVFAEPLHITLLLKAANDLGESYRSRFIWIGSDTWADSMSIIQGYEATAEGAITFRIQSQPVDEFKTYMSQLHPGNTKGIPDDWFNEFWQHAFTCRNSSALSVQHQYIKLCSGQERLVARNINQHPYVLHTIIATYMIAQGLSSIKDCSTSQDVSICLAQQDDRYGAIYNAISAAQWNVLGQSNFTFRFTERHGDIGYQVLNVKRREDAQGYAYQELGNWKSVFQGDISKYTGPGSGITTSVCPPNLACSCLTGRSGGDGGDTSTVDPTFQPQYQAPPGTEDRFLSEKEGYWGLIIAILSGLGALVALMLLFYLMCFYPVKTGTSILGFYLLLGILGVYVHNFAYIFYPTDAVCGIRRFCLGLTYAVCFSALLLKVLNTWRIGEDDSLTKYKRLSSPLSFFLIAVTLTLIQVIIATEWLILVPPKWKYEIYEEQMYPRCHPTDFYDEALIMSCIYVMVLIVLTAIFGVVTWNNGINHYESRWVLTATIITIGIWLIWILVTLFSPWHIRDPATAIANIVNATAILLCIYIRKLYLLTRYKKELNLEKKQLQQAPTLRGPPVYSHVYQNRAFDSFEPIPQGHSPQRRSPPSVHSRSLR